MHLIWPYLLKDSQTTRSPIHLSKPSFAWRLSVVIDLIFRFSFIMPVMPDKAAFVSAVLICVQLLQGKPQFYRF